MRAVQFLVFVVSASVFAAAPTSPPKNARPPVIVRPGGATEAPGGLTAQKRPQPRTADAQSEEVINAYLKAIGGRDALLAIQDRYSKFHVVRHSTTGTTPAVFERYLKRPGMVREDWDMEVQVGDEKLKVIQVYNGKTGKGWTKMMGFVAPLEGQMIYMLTWDKYIDDFFVKWKQDGYALRYRSGDGKLDTEPCHVVTCYAPTAQQQYRYYFSKKTGLLLKKQWRTDTQDGPVRTELFFSEYRKVNNPKAPEKAILFAFKREQLADGDLTMEREFVEVRLNSGLSDDIFGRPPGPIFQGRIDPSKKGGKKDTTKGEAKEAPKTKKKLPPWIKSKKRIIPKGATTEGSATTKKEASKSAEATKKDGSESK